MKLNMLVGLGSIVADSAHVLSRNGKAMALFSFLIPTIYSVLYLSNISDLIIIKPISFSPPAAASSPSPTHLNWFLIVPGAAAAWFFQIATVLASAAAYSTDNALSLKEVLLRTWRSSWIRPLTTVSCALFFFVCYIFLLSLLFVIPVVLLYTDNVKVLYASSIALALVAALVGTYLCVTLNMAIVVSILEETSGIKAIKRARQVVKGMELHGFALNLLLLVLSLVLFPVVFIPNIDDHSRFARVTIGFIVMSYSRLVWLFGVVSYTVLYYRCMKRRPGEDIEFSGIEYAKVAILPQEGTV